MNTSHHGRLLIPGLSVAALSLLSACQVDRIETPAAENYNREFIRQFGAFDTSQSWNTAKRANATIAPAELEGADRIEVYTAWPGALNSYLLASYGADREGETLQLDIPQGIENVYVRTLDGAGRVLKATYVPVKDGIIALAEQAAPVKTDLSSIGLYDLTSSPAFGGPIIKTEEQKTFWEKFTNYKGEKVYVAGELTLNHPDFQHLVMYDNEQFSQLVPEDGKTIEWGKAVWARIDDDATSPAIEIKVTFAKTEGDPVMEFLYIPDQWQKAGNLEIKSDTEATFRLENRGTLNLIHQKGFGIQGTGATITKIEYREVQPSEPELRYADIFNIYGLTESGDETTLEGYLTNFLKPNNSYDTEGYSAEDIAPIVGKKTGKFHEEVDENLKCNLDVFRKDLRPDDGVEYVVQADKSEVSIDFFFGVASFFNSLGYFYYKEDEKDKIEELLRKPKFILISNAHPGNNIKYEHEIGQWEHETSFKDLWSSGNIAPYDERYPIDEGKDKSGNWMHASIPQAFVNWAEGIENSPELEAEAQGYTGRMRSANYRLVYYDIDAEGKPKPESKSYDFPKGTHIAFFLIQNGHYWISKNNNPSGQLINNRRIAFSRPKMNYAIGNTINDGHSHDMMSNGYSNVINGGGEPKAWTAFVSYKWNGVTTMGVEDFTPERDGILEGGDHDMNDLLFRINGEVEREGGDEEMNEEKSPAMSWIVACEDLGGTFDYDFNDVVFGVSHVSGQTKATVTALAAGGTLPIYLQYGGKTLCPQGTNGGEFHSWWGSDNPSYSTINVHNFSKGIGKSIEIDVPEDFSLATTGDAESLAPTHGKPGDTDSDMGGFKVIVTKGDETTNTITAPKPGADYDAPQMFLVPVDWRWPRERQHISGVYPGFIDWTDGWWRNRDGEAKDNHINHGWKGAPADTTR